MTSLAEIFRRYGAPYRLKYGQRMLPSYRKAMADEELRQVARSHQKEVYDLLFRTSAEALQKLARDRRFVSGQIGLVGVLHTWGRDLIYHPHVHYLVPGGGCRRMESDGCSQRRSSWCMSNPSRSCFEASSGRP